MPKRMKQLRKIYREEFLQHQTRLIKNRVRFFCLLSLFIYILVTGVSFIIIPRALNPEEIALLKFLFICSALIYFLVKLARSMSFAKQCAYIYIVLLLYVITQLNFIYPAFIRISAATYVFALFFACFSIPWYPFETVIVTVMHITAYTILFIHSPRYAPSELASTFDIFYFFGGIMFLCLGFVLSFMVRRKEKMNEFENFILFKEEQSRNEQIGKELSLASKVYETLIPHPTSTDFADIDVKYIPVSYMSGDYARYYFIEKDLLLFIICDVTGHGVSAALLINRMHTEFLRLLKKEKNPEAILQGLNSFAVNEFSDINMYMSAFCGLADLQKGELAYSNYGHPSQYLYNSRGTWVKKMTSRTTLLGIMEDLDIEPEGALPLNTGDRIFLFTDGLLEVKDKRGREYGVKQLEKFILTNASLSPEAFNQSLLEEINRFKKGDFQDDIFLINILIKKTGKK